MTSPELVSRLLHFFLQHRDFWGFILGMGTPKLRYSNTVVLLEEWRKNAAIEMTEITSEGAGHRARETESGGTPPDR